MSDKSKLCLYLIPYSEGAIAKMNASKEEYNNARKEWTMFKEEIGSIHYSMSSHNRRSPDVFVFDRDPGPGWKKVDKRRDFRDAYTPIASELVERIEALPQPTSALELCFEMGLPYCLYDFNTSEEIKFCATDYWIESTSQSGSMIRAPSFRGLWLKEYYAKTRNRHSRSIMFKDVMERVYSIDELAESISIDFKPILSEQVRVWQTQDTLERKLKMLNEKGYGVI